MSENQIIFFAIVGITTVAYLFVFRVLPWIDGDHR